MMKSRKFLVKCMMTSSYFEALYQLKDRNIQMEKVLILSSALIHIFF